MLRRLDRRTLAGLLVAATVLTGALLVSPAVAVDLARGLADDPLLFGAVLVALYLVRPALAWPGTLLSLLVGYAYGIALGVPLALAGVVLTSLPTFYAARWFGRGDSLPRVRAASDRFFGATGGLRGVTAGKLAPLPADAVTAAAALSGVRLRALVLGTAVGEIPWTVAAVVVGASGARLTRGGLGALSLPVAVAAGVAAATLLAGPAYAAVSERRA